MRAGKGERKLRMHCTQHRNLFEVLEGRTIVCDAGGHTLAHNFPFEDWWEYCCHCRRFWPSDGQQCGKGREHCPACEKPIAVRYLCRRCMVMTNAPQTTPKGRGFRISVAGRVEPSCPGCSGVAPPVLDHLCEGARIPFTTARSTCPFCDAIIWEEDLLEENLVEEEQMGWPSDDAAASSPVATAAGVEEPQRVAPEDEAGAPLPTPQDDVLELWPVWESTRVDVEPDGHSQDAIFEVGTSRGDSFQSGMPQDAPLEVDGGASWESPTTARPSEVDLRAGTRESRTFIPDVEPATAVVSDPAFTIPDNRNDAGADADGGSAGTTLEVATSDARPVTRHDRAAEHKTSKSSREDIISTSSFKPIYVTVAAALLIVVGVALWYWWSQGVEVVPPPPDPTPTVSPSPQTPAPVEGMVLVAGDTFRMGRDGGDIFEAPSHDVPVAPFYLDKFEVTCEEYQRFVEQNKHPAPPGWRNGKYPPGAARLPVTGVSWRDADAYARSVGKRLPTEEEWEFAARGRDGRLYPWGNEWRDGAANSGPGSRGGLADVGSFKEGATPDGVYDLIGNAWEWTKSEMKPYPGGRLPPLPPGDLKVIRGGSWRDDTNVTGTYRAYLQARGGRDYSGTGFRCARDVPADARRQ